MSFTCEVKEATGDLSWLIIMFKFADISRRFLHPEQTSTSGFSGHLCSLQFLFLSRPFCPLPFPLGHFPFDTLLVDSTFLPSCTEKAFSCDGFALNKVTRPGWLSWWSSCGSCYVTWILCLYRSPIVCANPVLKHLIPDRGVTHMVIIMAVRFAGTRHLCNVLCLQSQKPGHTCLPILQPSCSRCMLDNRSTGRARTHRSLYLFLAALTVTHRMFHVWGLKVATVVTLASTSGQEVLKVAVQLVWWGWNLPPSPFLALCHTFAPKSSWLISLIVFALSKQAINQTTFVSPTQLASERFASSPDARTCSAY